MSVSITTLKVIRVVKVSFGRYDVDVALATRRTRVYMHKSLITNFVTLKHPNPKYENTIRHRKVL